MTERKRNVIRSRVDSEIIKNLSPELVHQILLSPTDVLYQMKKITKIPSPSFQQYQDEICSIIIQKGGSEINNNSIITKRAFHDNVLNSIMNNESRDLSPLFRLLIELHEKIRALVPNRKDLHCILNDDYNIAELSNIMMFLPWIIEAGKALSILESKFQSETTEPWIDLANTINTKHQRSEQKMMEKNSEEKAEATPALISSSEDELSFLICSLLYLMEKTGRTQKEKDAFYFEHVIIPYLCNSNDNNNSNNNGSEGFRIERNAMQNKCHSYLPITRKWIQSRVMTSNNITESHIKDDLLINHDECYQARKLFIIKGWIESILFEEKNEIQIPEIFYLDVNRIRSIRNMTRLAVTGCALGLHAANLTTSNRDNNSRNNPHDKFLLNDKLRSERLVWALRGGGGNNDNNNNYQQLEEHQFSQSSYEECIEDTMVGIAQEWAEETTSFITEDIIATLREKTKKVLRGQDPVIQLLNNRMKSIFLDLALDKNDLLLLSSPTTAAPYKIQSGRQKSMEGNSTTIKEEELTEHPVFVKNAEQVFCSRGLTLFATDLAHALLLSVKVPLLACDLYDKMILDIIQENDYKSVD